MTIRVVVGEDNYLAREAIAAALEDDEDITVVATCDDMTELRRAVDEQLPDVVLSDIRMPPMQTDEGIRLASELRRTHPEIGVVILSHHAEPAYAIELLEDGSDGRAYLLKERLQHREDISRAVREVAGGGSVVDPRIVEVLATVHRNRQRADFESLTPREGEILSLVAEGLSNPGIAEKTGITTRAVERHVHSIFAKLDLGDAEEFNRRVKAALLYLAGEVA